MNSSLKKVSAAGVMIALGIIYGDIGTSPLYTFQTILADGGVIDKTLVYGAISCVFWTLTLQTTFKYVIITLQADNHGEGGVFSLYALVRRYGAHLVYPAIIGAGTLMADGIITPPITITSAIEGLHMVKSLEHVIVPGNKLVMEVVMIILLALFVFQRFGTKVVGGAFGPIMFLWFAMLAILGIRQVIGYPRILAALNPVYGFRLLLEHPNGFWLLGAVFLCTTGAEALYSDLGHCGRKNIYVTWSFVKVALVLNYLGQGAWVMLQHTDHLGDVNPFFAIVPSSLLLPGILLATVASIIASQALISGSFTLISEAMSLGFWPRTKVKYPTELRGQIYIPSINWILFGGCILIVLYFRTSEAMTAAYGFSITVAMLMTTFLIYYFLRYIKKYPRWIVGAIVTVFVIVESSFFVANAAKLLKRLFFLVFEIALITTMYVWYNARKITRKLLKQIPIAPELPKLAALSADKSVPLLADNLVYLTLSDSKFIEQRNLDSIFATAPKKAELYWFIHIERSDDPYKMNYVVHFLSKNAIRVEFELGFRVQPRVGIMMHQVAQNLFDCGETKTSTARTDFRFVILERFLSYDNEFTTKEGFILNSYFSILRLARSDSRAYGIDIDQAIVEEVPLVVAPVKNIHMHRLGKD